MTRPATSYDGAPVVVAGAGLSGAAAARALRSLGAAVTVAERDSERSEALRSEGFAVADLATPPPGTALVVVSPGWRPDAPLLTAAEQAGVELIGEVELAWRLRPPGAAPWLAVTGTNGKTTTVRMLAAILEAGGERTVAAGNVGLPVLDAVLAPEPYDVLAVELSSFQLHWSSSLQSAAAAILNIAPDHLDWHGSLEAYAAAKARIWAGPVCMGNADDEIVRTLLSRSVVAAGGARRVTFTLRTPRDGELGLVQDLLVDRAFPDVPGEATELAELGDLLVPGAHNVANALAAAGLARSHGVSAEAVRAGLRAFRPDPHRNALVATIDGVAWVDDSKATNPHAAAASLAAYDDVVWIAGGLLKGATVDDLVRTAAPGLAGVVLLGTDREILRQALRRHAPQIPVVEVARLDTEAMVEAVAAARLLATRGGTVLLAPAAASMDCFRDYAQRGELFAAAVRAL
ncbi:MAG TPA: UDP-N-acetylmuramoyl-L-alanine--D-glutamate ligase [Mycobacteriales bacterium]|nr:UDP-N-acetylmuramoyl-L-alanine--D-glutamate ligase [Mycobacteriales bacterium]